MKNLFFIFLLMAGIILFLIIACSEPQEKHYSKATDLRGPEPAPILTVEEVTSGSKWNEYEYQIKNTGNAVLKLTDLPIVKITGENESEFSVTQQPLYQEIGPGLSLNFKIKFDPKSEEAKTANINIPNNSNNTPYVCSIDKEAKQYTLTINPNVRGNDIPSITFFNELSTTINSNPKSGFYHYKWITDSENITINQPRSCITTISLKGSSAVLNRIIYTFDPNVAPGIDLETIKSWDYQDDHHDYAFILANEDWNYGRDFCVANGGHLATIRSREESFFVCGNMPFNKGWLGGCRSSSNPDVFYWITGELFDYENWGGSEPSDKIEKNRIEMVKDESGNWFMSKASTTRAFICEWD